MSGLRASGPGIDGPVEVFLRRRAGGERDRMLILVWSGPELPGDVLAGQRRALPVGWWLRRLRRDARGSARPVQAEVGYAGQVVVRCDLAENGGTARFVRSHSGGRLDPGSFSLRYHAAPPEPGRCLIVRAAVVLAVRPELAAERLAGRLWPEPAHPPQPYPGLAELLALREALSR